MIEYTVTVCDNGDRFWFLNGELHREDGPAVEYHNGSKEWYKNSLLHREDGPAIEWANGGKEWYINGKYLTEEEFLNKTKKHTIIIDGQEIQISAESFNELKKSLN